jgi:hemolysin activation/secretion protein
MNSDHIRMSPFQLFPKTPHFQQWIARGLIPFHLVLCNLLSPARAQTVPDAGALRQQIEQGRAAELPQKSLTELVTEPEPMKDFGSAADLTVKKFQLRGNSLLSSAELQDSLKPYLDRPLSFVELRSAAAKIGTLYRQRGWVVRAYLPEQEIKEGEFTIQIIEAMFGATRIEGASTSLPLTHVQAMVDSAQPAGAPLNAERLDRALLLLNDVPGVVANGTLVSGERERETDLVLRLSDKMMTSTVLGADNAGSTSTGEARLNASLTLHSLFGIGEQFSATAMHTIGSDYGRAAMSLPVGNDGLRLGANASVMRYKLVSDQFAGLGIKGDSTAAGLEANYPLLRSRLKNAYIAMAYEQKRFDNKAMDVSSSNYGIDSLALDLTMNAFDTLGDGATTSGSLGLVSGQVNLDGSANASTDAATTNVAGKFTKLRYSLARHQFISDRWSVNAALSGQVAQKNLDSSEKFYLGGPTGVRAYPSGEGSGSSGQMISLEVRARLPFDMQLTGFYDWGRVTVNHDNNFPGSAVLNRYSLQGTGLALAWAPTANALVKATWGRRIGSNPNATSTGADQDGTRVINRFWLQALVSF